MSNALAGGKPLRTRIYVDGFNFYFGCLKGTHWKWLDPLALFEREILPSICAPIDENWILTEPAIKYFTANILAKAARAHDSVSCQARYHNALLAHLGPRIEIVKGYYAAIGARMKAIDAHSPRKQPRECDDTMVWKLEEKQTDVNLALALYHDVRFEGVEHVVVATNDTDIAPALRLIRRHTDARVGLVVPTRAGERQPSQELRKLAHWVRARVLDRELAASQLPRVVRGPKAVAKPISWYPRPDLVARALEASLDRFAGTGTAFTWLETPSPAINHLRPIELLDSDAGAMAVIDHLRASVPKRRVASLAERDEVAVEATD